MCRVVLLEATGQRSPSVPEAYRLTIFPLIVTPQTLTAQEFEVLLCSYW